MTQIIAAITAAWNILKTIMEGIKAIAAWVKDYFYKKSITEINKGVEKAKDGDLDQRLEGGKDVENNFNKHAP